ncbi:serpin-zx [Phtheirospermum japonicum]|uniref:Serpin-zx n=1 Tax=Phtheirospermum japonicum TaxID=374723 RepID=A0A830BPN2_9LAMI|nr:serpin-zx [Phtheirospermum japonicum]
MTNWKRQYVRALDGFKVLSLPYEQGDDNCKFSMLIYLPDAKDDLPALVDKFGLVPEFIQNHLPKWCVSVGDFRVPKFKIDFGFETSKVLRGQGLFSLSRTTSCIEVDEQGTEAAAVVYVCLSPSFSSGKTIVEEKVDFVADHPFLFVVREDVSGVVLFVGQLVNPIAG